MCVLGGRKRIGFGRTLCLSIRYLIILAELCVSYEQFVNLRQENDCVSLKNTQFFTSLTCSADISASRRKPLFEFPALQHRKLVAAVSSPQSPLCSVSASGENTARSLGSPLPTGPASLGSRGDPIFTCISGSPSPPARRSGCCTRSPHGP